jgi:HD-GYP domain-containing protein (c-di-GMP phosphodiesterase class II)
MTERRFSPAFPLRVVLFAVLLVAGAIPLALTNWILLRQNRELLETEERSNLTRSAQALSRELGTLLARERAGVELLGRGILGWNPTGSQLGDPRLLELLEEAARQNPDLLALRLVDEAGFGPELSAVPLEDSTVGSKLREAFLLARQNGQAVFDIAVLPDRFEPTAILSVPVEFSGKRLVVQKVLRLRALMDLLDREAHAQMGAFLIDRSAGLLWSAGADDRAIRSLLASHAVQDFVRRPLPLTAEVPVETSRGQETVLLQLSPVEEAGWGVVAFKPLAGAFAAVERMKASAIAATAALLLLAAVLAVILARALGDPIQRLIRTSHEIANGNFEMRLEERRFVAELSELARDFNRMSTLLEEHLAKLAAEAQRNRKLFESSIAAFAAAIDARDPYTRGHSERVAELSRIIARYLGQNEKFQEDIRIAGLLHDVGKIGIEDRILRKGGQLTEEEFRVMKEHPKLGLKILEPVEELRFVLPAVRSHHESWDGSGYPDGLRGNEIPLMARIVAVADCFDAITTDRPYQKAYTPEEAIAILDRLVEKRFDARVVAAFESALKAGELNLRRGGDVEKEKLKDAAEVELPAVANT